MNEELENTFALVRKQFLLIFAEAYAESNNLAYAAKCAEAFITAIMKGNDNETGKSVFGGYGM